MSVAKENAFDQFLLILIDWKMAIFPTASEFDEISFVRTINNTKLENIFLEFFVLVCDPGNLKCTFKIQYSDLNENSNGN